MAPNRCNGRAVKAAPHQLRISAARCGGRLPTRQVEHWSICRPKPGAQSPGCMCPCFHAAAVFLAEGLVTTGVLTRSWVRDGANLLWPSAGPSGQRMNGGRHLVGIRQGFAVARARHRSRQLQQVHPSQDDSTSAPTGAQDANIGTGRWGYVAAVGRVDEVDLEHEMHHPVPALRPS